MAARLLGDGTLEVARRVGRTRAAQEAEVAVGVTVPAPRPWQPTRDRAFGTGRDRYPEDPTQLRPGRSRPDSPATGRRKARGTRTPQPTISRPRWRQINVAARLLGDGTLEVARRVGRTRAAQEAEVAVGVTVPAPRPWQPTRDRAFGTGRDRYPEDPTQLRPGRSRPDSPATGRRKARGTRTPQPTISRPRCTESNVAARLLGDGTLEVARRVGRTRAAQEAEVAVGVTVPAPRPWQPTRDRAFGTGRDRYPEDPTQLRPGRSRPDSPATGRRKARGTRTPQPTISRPRCTESPTCAPFPRPRTVRLPGRPVRRRTVPAHNLAATLV